ncbi:hypothetical protein MTO96_036247 [Rhipicephalus appendiculatus]
MTPERPKWRTPLPFWRSGGKFYKHHPVMISLRNRGVSGTIDPRVLITAQDVKSAMSLRNTASGPDGFSAERLHSCPSILLRVLLNLLIMQKRLPLILCNARTFFIPKVPGASTASLHRPITVSHVLTRLLHKVFVRRLMASVKLDYRQRAFIPADGCAENLLLLQTLIDEAKHKLRHLAMASVDVAKAFDRVAHPAIVHGLRRKGVLGGILPVYCRLLFPGHHSAHLWIAHQGGSPF